MKLLIYTYKSLDDFMCCLPFIKSLQDMLPQASLHVASYSQYKPLINLAPYIHEYFEFKSREEMLKNESFLFEYDQLIDLDMVLDGKFNEELAQFTKVNKKEIHYLGHKVESLLQYIPSAHRRYTFTFQETLNGYEYSKSILKKEYGLLIYPFENSKMNERTFNLNQFLSQIRKMNPDLKILIIGFDHQSDLLLEIKSQVQFNENIDFKIVNYESVLSLIKKIPYFLTADSAIKYYASQSRSIVFDIHSDLKSIQTRGVFKNGSYCLFLNENPIPKFIFSAEEILFESNAHFLAYFITSVIDSDIEKIMLLTEGYSVKNRIVRTVLNPIFGWRSVPLFWNNDTIKDFLFYNAIKYAHSNKDTHLYEDVYALIMDESEYSVERILYEVTDVYNQVVNLRDIITKPSYFESFRLLDAYSQRTSSHSILTLAENYFNFQLKDVKNSQEYQMKLADFRKGIKDIQFFLSQFKVVASQKLLEIFDSTSDLRI